MHKNIDSCIKAVGLQVYNEGMKFVNISNRSAGM